MVALPIPTRSNRGRYTFQGDARLINAYSEEGGPDAKSPVKTMPCDGTVSFSAATDTPLRGFIYLEDLDEVVAVFASAAWKIESDGTATRLGTVPGTDNVQIVRNQKATPQVGILCAAGVFVIESDVVTKITDEDLPAVVSIAQLGGYTIFGIEDGRFFISSINEMTEIDGTDFATAEQSPDKLIRVWADRGELFLMSQRTIEPWKNTANADFPFEPLIGSTIPRGILAKNSVASFDNSFGWVGENGVVYRMDGYTPRRISGHDLERVIRSTANKETIVGFSWSLSGHEFYTLTDNASWTWTYDAATQRWHERKSYRIEYWRHCFAIPAFGRVLVGDRYGGSIYYLDADTATEAGDPLIWTVRFPTLHLFPNGGIADALHFDMATGYGLVAPAAQGHDPQVMLRISKDGGNTIAFERMIPLGKRGKYRTRVSPRRLGKFGPQGLVAELAISDPVARSVILDDAKIRPRNLQ